MPSNPVMAAAGTNQELTLSGRIINSNDSTSLADATYNMEFKIYCGGNGTIDSPSAGQASDCTSSTNEHLEWTEDRLVINGKGVSTAGGVFQIDLGSVNAFGSSVNWNWDTLWVSINIGSTSGSCGSFATCSPDGEMNPYIRLTAVPQALNADKLDGIDSSSFVQLGASQSGNVNIGSGSVTAGSYTGSGAVTLSSGGSSDLTFDSASNVIQIASSDTTLQRQASGNYTIDLKSASNTTKLLITNSGASGLGYVSAQNGYQINGAAASAGHYLRGDGTSYADSALLFSDLTSFPSACASGSAISTLATSPTCTGFIQNNSGAAQSSSNFHISGTGQADTSFLSPLFDAQAASGALGLGSTNGGAISIGNATYSTVAITVKNSATAIQLKNTNGTVLANVNTNNFTANNLVANPSFESTVSNWAAINSASTPAQSSAQAYEGNDSLVIATGTNASGGGAKYTTGTTWLSPSTTYTESVYVKTDSNLPVTTFEMGESDTGTNNACITAQALPTNGGWQKFNCTFTTGATVNNSYIYFKQTDAVNRNLYLDDIELTTDASTDPSYQNATVSFTGTVVNGAVVLQNAVNSNNALQVENSSGNTIFNVDTTDTNLVSNPGFETNQTGWTANGSAVLVRSSNQSYLGAYSLKVTASTTANNGAQFSLNPIVTSTGTTYTISWFAKLDATSSAMTDMAALFSADGSTTVACTPSDQTVVSTGWKRFSCSVASGATTPSASGFIRILQTGTTAGHIYYIDAVQLEAAASASAYGSGAVSLNGVIASPVTFKAPGATTAFQIQNASGVAQLTVDTTNNAVIVGASTKLQFANSTNSNTISILSGATAGSITVNLPATTPGASTQQGAANIPFVINLTADSAALSSTTLADITASGAATDALSLVIPAGATVKFNAQIIYVSSSTSNAATIGWKCSNVSQASTAAAILPTTASAVINGGTTTACTTTAANIVAGSTAGVTTPQLVTISGSVKANASSATTLTFEYARSGTTGSTTIKAGSNVTWWQ